MQAPLLISIVDDEFERHEALTARWKEIANAGGFEASIRCFSDFDKFSDIFYNRPHVVVVDNVLYDRKGKKEIDNRGIDFIAKNKISYQDTLFILCTQASFSIEVLGNKFPNPDYIFPKSCLSSKAFHKHLGKLFRESINRRPFQDQVFPNPVDANNTESCRGEIKSIMEQCIRELCRDVDQPDVQQVNLHGMSGGYSGAFVFKVDMFSDQYRKNIPLVLKVTKGRSTKYEASKYNAFVRLHLPTEMRVDLVGVGESGDYFGALYAFAFGSAAGINSAADSFRSGDFGVLPIIMDKIFESPTVGWYNDSKSLLNADEYYMNSDEYSPSKDSRRLSSLKDYAVSQFGDARVDVNLEKISVGKHSSTFTRKNMFKFDKTLVPEVLCHGDFNSNNIIFNDEKTGISTIDFEYSGWDCIYKDFISLECSLRVDERGFTINTDKDFSDYAACEVALIRNLATPKFPKHATRYREHFSRIGLIRNTAREVCQRSGVDFDVKLYTLSLSLHLFKILGISGWEKSNANALLASFIASSKYLEEI